MRSTSPKGRTLTARAAAAKRLLLDLGDKCEWCSSPDCWPVQLHHHAGRTGELIDDLRFLLLLGGPCHQAIEERIMGADGLAAGLALLRHLGRRTVREYWQVTGREYPPEGLVEAWSKRINREGR